MDTAKLTIRLPKSDISFLKEYAKQHGITVSELIDRYIKRLQISQKRPVHPDIEKIAGIVPHNIDAKILYHAYSVEKHQS